MSSEAERGPDLVAQAHRLNTAGEYETAVSLLAEATRDEPRDPEALFQLGWALENLDPPRLDEARAAYGRAIDLEPGHLHAGLGLATVLEALGEPAEAREHYRDVVESASAVAGPDPETLEVLGWSRYRLGDHIGATGSFRAALDLDPDVVSVRLDLGLCLLCDGRGDDGLAEYAESVRRADAWPEPARRRTALRVGLHDLDLALVERPELRALPQAAAARSLLSPASASGGSEVI